jgi:hypothetical protein
MAAHEVPKHIAAIHISNRLSFLERKVSNVLLRNAWNDLLDQEAHTIRIADLSDAVGFDSKDTILLKAALTELVNTTMEWNIVGQDKKNQWRVSGILGSVFIDEKTGMCEYTYPKHLRELFRNPNIFARLNLVVQRQFNSKYSLALWEYATGQVALSGDINDTVLTPWLELDVLHKLLGSDDSQYPERYKKFNQDVLKPAINEVNTVSDIEIVETEQRREHRKITALRFSINQKGVYEIHPGQDIPKLFLEIDQIVPTQQLSKEKSDLIARLVENGIDEKVARGLVRGYGVDRITENLEWAVRQINSGRKIERPGGFITSAIRRDFVAPERVKRKKVQQIKQREQTKQDIEAFVEKITGDFWLQEVDTVKLRIAGMSSDEKASFEKAMEDANVFMTATRWAEYRREGITDKREHTALRAFYYNFAMRRLLTDEERDIIAYAQSKGADDETIKALQARTRR